MLLLLPPPGTALTPHRIHHCLNSLLMAWPLASETLTWTLAWTKNGWGDFLYVLILHSCIGIDGPGWNPIPSDYQQQTSRVKMEKGSFASFQQLSFICLLPLLHIRESSFFIEVEPGLAACATMSPEPKSVPASKCPHCQVESCRGGGADGGGCFVPHTECRHLPPPPMSQQRHTGSRRVSPSVTREAGRPRTGSGIGPRARGPPSSRHRHM